MENSNNINLYSKIYLAIIIVTCSALTYWVLNIVSLDFQVESASTKSIDVNEKLYNSLVAPNTRYSTNPHTNSVGRTNPFDKYK